jgi:hypothetical protein
MARKTSIERALQKFKHYADLGIQPAFWLEVAAIFSDLMTLQCPIKRKGPQ